MRLCYRSISSTKKFPLGLEYDEIVIFHRGGKILFLGRVLTRLFLMRETLDNLRTNSLLLLQQGLSNREKAFV